LVDLVFADPVVLVGIEHGDQNIEVCQQVLKCDIFCDFYCVVRTLAPLWKFLVKSVVLSAHPVPEWLEQSPHERLATTTRQQNHSRGKGKGHRHELRSILAVPRHGRVENPGDGNNHERRGDIGSVIHVLLQQSSVTGWPASIPD